MRDAIATKTREVIFSTFGKSRLLMINTNARPAEISFWKKRRKVEDCYKSLFKKINSNQQNLPLMLVHIIKKVFSENDYSNTELAYVMAICSTLLNPRNDEIMLKKNIMKRLVKKFLASFYIILKYLIKYHFMTKLY